jgi:hypothetical protein
MKLFARARPLVAPITLCLMHVALLYALDAWRVVGRVLGAVRPNVALVLLVVAFLVLRLVVFFVVPGWIVLALMAIARGPKARAVDRPSVSERSS